MKSYNGLYNKMISDNNIQLALINAGRNKYKNNRRHKKLRKLRANPCKYTKQTREMAIGFTPLVHTPVEINDGISAKKRHIIVPTVKEVVVQHMMANVLQDIFMPSMYEHSYASIPGKGLHKAVKFVKKWIQKDHKNTKYCLKLDIKKFFDSVDQDVLLAKLRKIIRDDKFFRYVEMVVRTVDKGIPLGFVTSQWFANFLLTELDHKIKEEWHVKYYIRFMDDMVLFGSNKRELHKVHDLIAEYLEKELHLQLKSNWQLFYVDSVRGKKQGHFLDFLGFKFYRNHVALRSRLALKIQRKAKRISKKERANIRDARQMVTYAGLVKCADCRNWFRYHVLQYVSIKNLRKKISNYDKRRLALCG